jgi:uncharacterized protein (UPF0276 family)
MPTVPTAPGSAVAGTTFSKPLGIGFPYISVLPPELYRPGLLDFVELTPDTLCQARRDGAVTRLDLAPERLERARKVCGALSVVVHGVELSIGSAQHWNVAYLDMLDRLQACWPFVWHSEHLSYQTIPGENGAPLDIGVPLPLSGTWEAVGLVAERAAAIRQRYGVPFLLENPAHYLIDLPYEREIEDEIGLMTQITARSGCGQLLDLHNLYCNSVNLGFDPSAAIERTALGRVIEIHVAGGSWRDGFWMDAHNGRVPDPVWELLAYTLPRCPNIAGVVYELLEDYAPRLGVEAIEQELTRARYLWERHGPGSRGKD